MQVLGGFNLSEKKVSRLAKKKNYDNDSITVPQNSHFTPKADVWAQRCADYIQLARVGQQFQQQGMQRFSQFPAVRNHMHVLSTDTYIMFHLFQYPLL
jgi:hypothetical protein